MLDLLLLGIAHVGYKWSASYDPLSPDEIQRLPREIRQVLVSLVPQGEVVRKHHVEEARERLYAQQQRSAMK